MELVKKRVRQYAIFYEKQIWTDETVEAIVPDIFPDAERIIGSSAEVKIKEKAIAGGKIKVQCEIYNKIFCQSGENTDVFLIESTMPYSYSWEAEGCADTDFMTLNCGIMQSQPIMINPRKLSNRVQLSFEVRVFQKQELEYTQGASCEQAEKMNMLTEKVPQTIVVATAEKHIGINEEIRITGTNQSATDRLYRCDTEWVTDDVKVMTNKVMVRGSCRLKVVTMSEKAAFVTQNTYSMPFSQIIEIDNTDINDNVSVEYQTIAANTKIAARQDGAAFLCCEISGNAVAIVRRSREIELLTDMYSTAYDTNFELSEILAPTANREIKIEAMFKDTMELEPKAVRVHDSKICSKCQGIAENESTVSGIVCVETVYETAEGQICTAWKKIQVEAPIEGKIPSNPSHLMTVENAVVSCDADGNITVSGKAVWMITFTENKKMQCVKSCQIDKTAVKNTGNHASLILRCIDDRDSVWGMAKKYNTTPEQIMLANKITAQGELAPGRLIMIPFGQ